MSFGMKRNSKWPPLHIDREDQSGHEPESGYLINFKIKKEVILLELLSFVIIYGTGERMKIANLELESGECMNFMKRGFTAWIALRKYPDR